MALAYGAILLRESISINSLGGLALVLIGVILAGKKTATKLSQVEMLASGKLPMEK
jgi:drug/metabolite transporter (DMT)-like permease